MLKYKVRITNNDFKNDSIIWKEKYLALDLSFISGVTDYSYHLERHDKILGSSPYANQNTVLNVETDIVTRLGFIEVKDKEYPIKSFIDSNGNIVKYVFINGQYYYIKDGKITINEWQKHDLNTNDVVEEDIEIEVGTRDKSIKLSTIYWIEDGYVTIDGFKYIFDNNEYYSINANGVLKYTDNGAPIFDKFGGTSVEMHPYTSSTEIHDVCKFKATPTPYKSEIFNDIRFVEYFFYIPYDGKNCPIILNENGKPQCEVYNGTENVYYDVSGLTDSSDSIIEINNILSINELVGYNMICEIPKSGDTYYANYDYRTTNSSDMILIDASNQSIDIGVGDYITLENIGNNGVCYLDVETIGGAKCVFFNGKKYYVEDKMFDKCIINDNEYDIVYDDLRSDIAYVVIDEELVPMALNGNTLTRYGYIVSGAGESLKESFTIKSYSGVNIDGKKYIVDDDVAIFEENNKFKLIVEDIKGNSALICSPYVNPNDYDKENIYNKKYNISSNIVLDKYSYVLSIKNNIFGNVTTSKESALSYTTSPSSSEDIYNLFDHLQLYVGNGHIDIPLSLSTKVSNDLLQSEIIQKEFCEKERDKTINKIVDMEKDIYVPKTLSDERYIGSNSTFENIFKINFNLHFRTRNMDNWKVNEGYNDRSVSGTADNWFITDYYPYKNSSSYRFKDNVGYIQVSDLLGLLFFDNNDVYYQKSRISNSFLRLSIYDSIDPQNQSLLAMSTIFMDGHSLYKKFIDNSKKDGSEYLKIALAENKMFTSNTINVSAETIVEGNELDSNRRIDSRFTVTNKYDTESSSSEGFYIYMFREYSENLHPKPIYMKIEFNHAGIGKTIPFIIPMKWETNAEDNKIVNPKQPLTLDDSTDLKTLKKGVPLSRVYAQSYIPLYAVYDFKNKEYAYVFDKRYVTVNNGVANVNLFELKISETDEDTTSVIDINYQFKR